MSEQREIFRLMVGNLEDGDILSQSPFVRAAHLMLNYIEENGPIGLTKNGWLKRNFVNWAVDNFEWPYEGREEVFKVYKFVDEHHFFPVYSVHDMLRGHGLVRTYKGAVAITKKGREANQPKSLFLNVLPPFMFAYEDPFHYTDSKPHGSWDIFLNVISLQLNEHGILTEREIFESLYGPQHCDPSDLWRIVWPFRHHVLDRLVGAGLLIETRDAPEPRRDITHRYAKSSLWRTCVKLESDRHLQPRVVN